MVEHKERQTIEGLVTPTTLRSDCVEVMEGLLTPDEVKLLGGEAYNAETIAAEKVIETMSWLGVFAPAPATFNKEAYVFTATEGLSEKEAEGIWNILKQVGVLKNESAVGEGRVSISKDLIIMLKNPYNGYLT